MCGIVGYVGTKDAAPILLAGLQALEYRGYDSAGVYMPKSGMHKSVGSVLNLVRKVGEADGGNSGIAHTRWATHGPPTEANAHPHRDQHARVYIVHNGIIENYRELRDWLSETGHTFYSDTDTETLAQYIGSLLPMHKNLEEAVRAALSRVRGTYGIAVMRSDNPTEIVAARMGSPLVIGIAPHGHLVASDPSALLAHTKKVVYLEDGQCAVVRSDAFEVYNRSHGKEQPAVEEIEWDQEAATKGGHPHYMLKEILEGPDVIRNTMRGRLLPEEGSARLGGLRDVERMLGDLRHISIIGCGSAYYAGLVGKYLLERYVGIPVSVDVASEFRYYHPVFHDGSAVLAVSQSGETIDTLSSIKMAKAEGVPTLGIVNVVGSTIARETDAGVYNHAGPEIGVASTKAFLSQLTVFAMLSLYMGRMRGLREEDGKAIVRALTLLPDQVEQILANRDAIKRVAEKYAGMRDALYIGRGALMPIALEGALKLKEVSYIHAEGYGSGEMKHGPIAMIDESFPTVALAPKNALYEKNVSNIEEVRARKGPVIAIATEGDRHIEKLADDIIYIPDTHEATLPILATVPLHLFAYYVGVAKGYDVDKPRNLAKSVTVE
jgi:glutamine---fructose-6-phosphate transaminase (isomerizing)